MRNQAPAQSPETMNSQPIVSCQPPFRICCLRFLASVLAGATPVAFAGWQPVGQMNTSRSNHTATLVANGKVLVVGGYNSSTGSLASAEIYDSMTRTWSNVSSMSTVRTGHTATLLADGRVLVVGGNGLFGGSYLASAEAFAPSSQVWMTTAPMKTGRMYHTATKMNNGKVLVTGGWGTDGNLSKSEVYDPVTEQWSDAAPMLSARVHHGAILLGNGKVLVCGGKNTGGISAKAEIYDPVVDQWSVAGDLVNARESHSLTMLPNGKVLAVCGENEQSGLTSAELFDPGGGTFMLTSPLSTLRDSHTSTLLANGRVLVTGGFNNGNPSVAEWYDPATALWTTIDPMSTSRESPTATLLPNGDVLVAGGKLNHTATLSSAELFSYLPVISSHPANVVVYQGKTATFRVSATGDGLGYQWQKDGSDITGETSPELVIPAAQSSNVGSYRVIVSNTGGSVVSGAGTLSVIPDADGDCLSDEEETGVYLTDPAKADTDDDGLDDHAEVIVYKSNPFVKDSDADGFDDSFEVSTGFSPTSPASTPDAQSHIRTAVEFRFNSANGASYRIEDSTDLEHWAVVENGIAGNGGVVTRFYSTENCPKRYFRVRRN